MKKLLMSTLFFTAFSFGTFAQTNGPVALVEGTVVSLSNRPIPGVTVSIWSPTTRRLPQAYTNQNGYYSVPSVPINYNFYYIEIYWNEQLLARDKFYVGSELVSLPPFVLNTP